MALRGLRGATLLTADDKAEMLEAVTELVAEMMTRNAVDEAHVVSIIFTATPDIHSGFPAAAARTLGFQDVPLLCAQELDVDGAVPFAIRVLMHADLPLERSQVQHVYLRGSEVLRQDLQQ